MIQVQQQLITLQDAKTQLEQDNLALYTKIRFLQQQGTMTQNPPLLLGQQQGTARNSAPFSSKVIKTP
jgi:hypothetical protein